LISFLFYRISKTTNIEINYKTQLSVKPTMKENNSADFRIPVSKLFPKSKQLNTTSPLPITAKNIPEKTASNTVSGWSSSTNSDTHGCEARSWADNFNLSEETTVEKNNISQYKKLSNVIKPSAKSKLVLENVRKMIKEQNIQQKESIRL
jgi:hypothetical protein